MVELPRSSLPEDPEYWEALARRARQDAAEPLAQHAAAARADRAPAASWYDVLSQQALVLVAASLAAMLILWVLAPAPSASAALRWMERSLFPDEAAGSLVAGPAPPDVETLLAQFTPATADGERR